MTQGTGGTSPDAAAPGRFRRALVAVLASAAVAGVVAAPLALRVLDEPADRGTNPPATTARSTTTTSTTAPSNTSTTPTIAPSTSTTTTVPVNVLGSTTINDGN